MSEEEIINKEIIIQDYWWEDELIKMLVEFSKGDIESDSIVLFITKVINAERGCNWE